MILNRQRRVRVPIGPLEAFLAHACRELRIHRVAVTVCMVTSQQIAKWNAQYRRRSRPTDVLSFPASNDNPRKSDKYLGDIAISPAVAERDARASHRALEMHLRILILHGLLHLLGYDHETDNGQMDRREAALRRRLKLV